MINLASENDITHVIELIYGRYGNVENKSSETVRSEITSENVTNALGYVPLSPTSVLESAFRQDGEIEV